MAKSKMVFPLYASLFEDGNESEEAILLVDMIDDLMVRMAATRNQVPSLRSPPGFDDYYVLYHTLSGTIHNMELSMRDLDHSLMFLIIYRQSKWIFTLFDGVLLLLYLVACVFSNAADRKGESLEES